MGCGSEFQQACSN